MAKACYAIILAAGSGSRMNNVLKPKQFYEVMGKNIMEYTVDKFEKSEHVDQIIIVSRKEYQEVIKKIIEKNRYSKVADVIEGGRTRRESSLRAVDIIEDNDSLVLIHDAVRPFVTGDLIGRCVSALTDHDAVYPAVPSEDTVIETNGYNMVADIPLRSRMMRGQTPQGFKYYIIKEAHTRALSDEKVDDFVTNECGLVLRYKLADIHVIEGDRYNFKITHDEDLLFAESYLKQHGS